MRPNPSHLALAAALLALATARPARASGTAEARLKVVPLPSSRRFVSLDDLSGEVDAQVLRDELTGVYRLERGNRRVAVAPGVAAALVGSELLELDDPVLVRYGRAYVPRWVVPKIQRLFGKQTAEPPEPPPAKPPQPGAAPRYLRRVCIDSGHGGRDPGAIGRSGVREKLIVLSAAQALGAELRKRGFEVVMTREGDDFIELNNRPAFAAQKGADLFVSLHANSIPNASISGIEIFYCDSGYDAAALARDAARAGRVPKPADVGGVHAMPSGSTQAVLEMLFEQYHRESIELAEELRQAFTRAGLSVRSVRSAGFRVLRLSETPAVLIELGFLTNPTEERLLRTTAYQQRLASAIADGIEAHRLKLERTRGPAR